MVFLSGGVVMVKRRAVLYRDPATKKKQVLDTMAECGGVNCYRIDRIYRIKTRDGREMLCRMDISKRWWYPLEEGVAPVRNRAVVSREDVTASMVRVYRWNRKKVARPL